MDATAAEVIVDDRLATVLATVPAGHAGARTQYRQLLDLLGRMPPDFALPAAADARLAALEDELDADERAELIGRLPGSLRHPGLVLRLAAQPSAVAAAAVAGARLDDWQWSTLALELPHAARGHLRHRRDLGPRTRAVLGRLGIRDLGLPSPDSSAAIVPPPPALAEGADGIAAIVRRIEAFRRNRQAGTRQFDDARPALREASPRLPLGEFAGEAAPPLAIRIESGAHGRIVAAEPPFAAMLAGMALGGEGRLATTRCDARTARAVRQRRPVCGGRIELDGAPAIAGAWRIDASPRFAAHGGRFLGYRGLLRRPAKAEPPAAEGVADRLRQLLHELRTPVNAIQGFAELIQQQLFGPTPHQYRSLAAGIAADSAAVLAGFEEIDRLVKLETGRGEAAAGRCDLTAVIERLLDQLRPGTGARGAAFAFEAAGPAPVAMAEGEAERMLWRTLALLATEALPGELLTLALAAQGDFVALAIALPEALARRDEAALFALLPVGDAGGPALGLLGGGFALRLARAEARAAGGDLERDDGRLIVRLPGLTPSADAHSAQTAVSPRVAGGA
ncbi:MAG: sensor histidine kinase [Novosphingobium sp.]|nr:sensor histidine kinase [Novosphingobium sp.]